MKHHKSIIALHWLTGLLILSAFTIILCREGLEDGDQRKFWLDLHRSIGLSVLAIVLVRALARLVFGREPVVRTTPLLHAASVIGQFIMYAAMIALPLLGWAQSSARAHHFKLFDQPMLSIAAYDPDRADSLGEWHETLAWVFLAVIALHILAALWHHFIRRDGILRSMLPGKTSR